MNNNNEWSVRNGNEGKFNNEPWWVGYDKLFPLRREYFSSNIFKYNPKSVLEVGCTGGANIAFFPKNNLNNVIGIDINKDALAYATQTKSGPKYYHHDITDPFTFLDSKVDIVCSMGVLIHIRSTDIDNVLKHMVNASKKGLVLIETSGENKSIGGGSYPQWIHDIPTKLINIDNNLKITVTPLTEEINDIGASASKLTLIEATWK